MGPKSRILESEIGPFSDFKRKPYLTDLKSAHSQESDFHESGEVDRFLKMGTRFQERSGSLENGLCVTWSGFWLCPGYFWLLILVAVEQIYDQITRRLVAQRVAPAARAILSQTPKISVIEVIDGNDGVLAAGIAVAATMQLFLCTPENRTHIVLRTSPQENVHLTIPRRAAGRY